MVLDEDLMRFVAAMARLGRDDREVYRLLRQEAWEMVQRNHERQSPEQRRQWLSKCS